MPAHRRTGKPRGNPNWTKKADPAAAPVATPPTIEDDTVETDDDQAEGLTFEVEDAPVDEPVEQEPLSAMERVRAMAKNALHKAGFTSSDEAATSSGGKASTAVGGRLNKKQQAFADSITPVIVLALVLGMQWAWTKRGAEYAILAPDDETATKIVGPLIRIMARHAKGGGLSPDNLDLLAAFGAIVAYGRVTQKKYIAIRENLYDYEPEGNSNEEWREPTAIYDTQTGRTTAARVEPNPYEVGYVGRDYRRSGANGAVETGEGNGGASRVPGSVNLDHLTERERRQYTALRVLADRDTASRMRRSGRVRLVFGKAG